MNGRPNHTGRRDAGFTLTELLITIVVSGIIVPVIAMAIVVSLRTLPGVGDRADAGVAVQGITTWLPSDVDSTEPGGIDANPATASGCQGTDPGTNVIRLTWTETFRAATVRYVADYRFVVKGTSGHIVRISCSGSPTLGVPATLSMSGLLTDDAPGVTITDSNLDGRSDRVRLSVKTLAGPEVFIDAVSKNLGQTLPIPPPDVEPTVTNRPPEASAVSLQANPLVPLVIALPAVDPDGDVLTTTLTGVPAGWVTVVNGTTVTITPLATPTSATIGYTVTDTGGLTATSTITIGVVVVPTTTTTTTTTTTIPPACVLSSMSISPSSTVDLTGKGTGKLKHNVKITITLGSGYCVGLTLQYETGAPNGQYIQNFGDKAPYSVTLVGNPSGTELWAPGVHPLVVVDGTGRTVATQNLTVTD